MTLKHTPGPWKWNLHEGDHTKEPTLIGANGEEVCDFGDSEQYYPTAGWSGSGEDMHLIAAAPDLLAACLMYRDMLTPAQECCDAMDAAIKKALGE